MKFIFMTMIMEKDEKGRERESHIAYGKVQCILICALGLNVPESYSLVPYSGIISTEEEEEA